MTLRLTEVVLKVRVVLARAWFVVDVTEISEVDYQRCISV